MQDLKKSKRINVRKNDRRWNGRTRQKGLFRSNFVSPGKEPEFYLKCSKSQECFKQGRK